VTGPSAAPVRGVAPAYRPATGDDLAACTRVWRAGLADYLGRLNADDGLPTELGPLHRLLAHAQATDPDRFWVAVRPGDVDDRAAPGVGGAGGERVVGFGSATVRGRTWFLGMLFVDPAEQGGGIGRALLDRTLDGGGAGVDGLALGTATDSAQPISNALYARLGIVPRLPILHLVGRPAPGRLPELPAGIRAVPFDRLADGAGLLPIPAALADPIAAIDRAIVGHERPDDHAWMLADGRIGRLFVDATGAPVGYGYSTPVGRIGPVATLDPDLLPPAIATLLEPAPPGASSLWVPGAAGDAVAGLLRAGLSLEPFPALLCWTTPIADFSRYLPITLALV
jgi:GNAT superfamily N-acetyltransferase